MHTSFLFRGPFNRLAQLVMALLFSILLTGCSTMSNSDKFAFAEGLPKPDVPPKMTKMVQPIPPEKLHALDSVPVGKITVIFVVEMDGTVIEAEAKGGDPRLREATIKAVKQCLFEPGLKDGKAVRSAAMAVTEFRQGKLPKSMPTSGYIPRQIPAPQ